MSGEMPLEVLPTLMEHTHDRVSKKCMSADAVDMLPVAGASFITESCSIKISNSSSIKSISKKKSESSPTSGTGTVKVGQRARIRALLRSYSKMLGLSAKRKSQEAVAKPIEIPAVSRSKSKRRLAEALDSEVPTGIAHLNLSGDRLKIVQRVARGTQNPQEAKRLLSQFADALQTQNEPRTFLQDIRSSGGTGTVMQLVISLVEKHGAVKEGIGLEVLLAGWTVCGVLAERPTVRSRSLSKLRAAGIATMSKWRVPGQARKNKQKPSSTYQSKVHSQTAPAAALHPQDAKALWNSFPLSNVLSCLGQGAESLDRWDFERLIHTAWALLDEHAAVRWHMGHLDFHKVRVELRELMRLHLFPGRLAAEPAEAYRQLAGANHVLQNLAGLCGGNVDLAKAAAIYGVTFLVEGLLACIKASVSLIAESTRNSTLFSQSTVLLERMTHTASVIIQALAPHMQELLPDCPGACLVCRDHCHPDDDVPSSAHGNVAVAVAQEAWRRFVKDENVPDPNLQMPKNRFCTEKELTPNY